jgi:hypothetical protein
MFGANTAIAMVVVNATGVPLPTGVSQMVD